MDTSVLDGNCRENGKKPKLTLELPIYSASRFSRGTVLDTLKQSRINIMRGKNDATTYPDKPVS